MLYTEWNWDTALEVRYEEGVEDGVERGIEKNRQYVLEMLNQGLSVDEIKQRLTKTTTN